ncbi:MAG: ribonuclease J, partial [Gemmatimonadota bacterium]|nr:ribonuclease J [Gemmatimonadota bacterium]
MTNSRKTLEPRDRRSPRALARDSSGRDKNADPDNQSGSARTPGQRPPRPKPGRRPQRDSQGSSRSRTGRSVHTPSAPQHPRSERDGLRLTGGDVAEGRLRVIPLGGTGEIGKSMLVVEYGNDLIVIDAGGKFPEEWERGIDLIIPDIRYVKNRLSKLRGIAITHGHEDHIGALAHLLKEFPETMVYATKFTLHLIQKKLEEHKVTFKYTLYDSQSELNFKGVDVFPVHVNHSIPETCGLIIRSKDRHWGALYISDFKVDLYSKHERPIDLSRIQRILSECKETAYFMDSTNILNDGKTTAEGDLHADLKALLERDESRIFITLFASNVHRMNTIAKMGRAAGRKMVIMGRSLKNYMEAAYETGHSDIPPEEMFQPAQVKV